MVITDDKMEKMEKELETINKSLKGKKKLDTLIADSLDLPVGNTKPDMFEVIKELYSLSKRALALLKTKSILETPAPQEGTATEALDIVRKELAQFRQILIEHNKGGPDFIPEMSNNLGPSETHTLTLEGQNEADKITEELWSSKVKKHVASILPSIPIKGVSGVKEGTAKLKFKNKELMEKAKDALSVDYKVSAKSHTVTMLEPKLTMYDLKGDFESSEELRQSILDKNSSIKSLVEDESNTFKVIFLEKNKTWACLQVSVKIRQSIRESGDFVHADLGQYKVKDRYHVIQCFDCQSFGHMSGSDYCKCKKYNADPVCFYCAGAHKSKDCEKKTAGRRSSIKCTNCSNSKDKNVKDKCKTHSAADRLCPSYVREQSYIMNRTSGCETSKNSYLQWVKIRQKELGIN